MAIASTEPAALQAGDTLSWRRQLADYPADDGWTLAYRLINASTRIDIVAGVDGADHLVTVPAATSAAYGPGDYTYSAYVTRGTDRYTVGQGSMRVLPDLAGASGAMDGRTPAQRALEDLRAALSRWLATSGHVSEYSIAGRTMRFASAADIRARISIAEREADREAAALGLQRASRARRVLVRF